MPSTSAGTSRPAVWGEPAVLRERFGDKVRDLVFDAGTIWLPALSPAHVRVLTETNAGPVSRLIDLLGDDSERLAQFRA